MAESNNSVVTSNENTPKPSKSGQNLESQDINKTENVLRPILVEDYKYEEYPESLQNLMKTSNNASSRIDVLFGVIYLLMLESGFVPTDYSGSDCLIGFSYQRVIMFSKKFSFNTRAGNKNNCLKMILPNLQQFEIKLVIVDTSDGLIVNCFVKGIESGYFNTLLDPLTYFTSSNTDLSKVKFQQLDHLSRCIKDEIAFKAKCSILKQMGITSPCIENLPNEIVLIIMRKLPLLDLIQFGKTNWKFCDLMRDLMKTFGKKMQ